MNINHQPVSSLESQVHSPKFSFLFKQTIAFFTEHLFQKNDPVVWEKIDRNGQSHWVIYDPRTQHSVRFDSETDVRVWLEKRFYS